MSNHHALLYFSTNDTALQLLLVTRRLESEVTVYKMDVLSISEVRQLITTAYLKPQSQPTRTIVIVTGNITVEAQQALLKILEEPPLTTKFILWLRSGTLLLPTLRSRLDVQIAPGEQVMATPSAIFANFKQSTYATRIEQIATLTKNKDVAVLAEMSEALGQWLVSFKSSDVTSSTHISWCLSQLELRGASKKMLWEEIALLLPVEN